jgi:hypothetical protein
LKSIFCLVVCEKQAKEKMIKIEKKENE